MATFAHTEKLFQSVGDADREDDNLENLEVTIHGDKLAKSQVKDSSRAKKCKKDETKAGNGDGKTASSIQGFTHYSHNIHQHAFRQRNPSLPLKRRGRKTTEVMHQ
jgi:hypothetical protein